MAEFEHIPLLHKIAEHLEANNRLLEKLVERGERVEHRLECMERVLVRIERRLPCPTDATSGVIRRIPTNEEGDTPMSTNLAPLGPGVTAKFQVTWTEGDGSTDTGTLAANTAWTSSDPTNFPAVMDPTDPTGSTVDVAIPAGETTTESVTLTAVYTNADGTTATATAVFDLIGGAVTIPDVTAGQISRIA